MTPQAIIEELETLVDLALFPDLAGRARELLGELAKHLQPKEPAKKIFGQVLTSYLRKLSLRSRANQVPEAT